MIKKVFFLIILLAIWTNLSFSAIDESAGKSGAKFLLIPVGARATGMGEAFVGLSNDVNAVYWNPAGMALNPVFSITGMHYEWFQDIRYDFLGFTRPLNADNAVGFYVGGLYAKNLEGTTGISDDGIFDEFNTGDYFMGLSYSRNITAYLSAGITAKGIYQKIDTENAKGVAFDFALHGHPRNYPFVTFGFNLQNVGPQIKFKDESNDLPMNIKAGIALYLSRYGIILASDLNKPNDNKLRLNSGLEYWIKDMFAFRTGYRYKFEGNDSSDDNMTFGVGFRISDAQIDYAFVPYGNLGDTHRIAITYGLAPLGFGVREPEPIVEIEPPEITPEEEEVEYIEEEQIQESLLFELEAEEDLIEDPSLPNKQTIDETKKRAVEDLYSSGTYKFQNEMFEQAQEDFEKILNLYLGSSRNDEAYYMIGQCYFEQGKYENAITYFQNCIEDSIEVDMDSDSQLMIGYSYFFLKEYVKAKEAFEKVLENYPNSEAVKGGEASHWIEKCNKYIQ